MYIFCSILENKTTKTNSAMIFRYSFTRLVAFLYKQISLSLTDLISGCQSIVSSWPNTTPLNKIIIFVLLFILLWISPKQMWAVHKSRIFWCENLDLYEGLFLWNLIQIIQCHVRSVNRVWLVVHLRNKNLWNSSIYVCKNGDHNWSHSKCIKE